ETKDLSLLLKPYTNFYTPFTNCNDRFIKTGSYLCVMPVKTYGSAVYGIEAITITVEVNMSGGTKYYIVGLPDNAVKESLFRIESALNNSGFRMPRKKIIVNLAPADIRKEGSSYD